MDLEEDDQSENITQLSMFMEDPEKFSSFRDYNVMEGGRGVVDISVAGIVTPCVIMVQGRYTLTVYYNR